MKKFTSFCLLGLMMILAIPQAKAIITDPDDYIIWDSGILADSMNHKTFVMPDFMNWSPGVQLKAEVNVLGRGFTDEYMEDYGFAPGVKAADHKGSTKIGALVINQRKATDESAVAAGERFALEYIDFLKLKGDEKNLPWTYSKADNKFYRPSDSIVIRVPKTCDSIYIQGLGSNSYYSLMVYEVGVSEVVTCNKGVWHGLGGVNRTNVYHTGGNWGYVQSLGIKPQHVAPGDSTTIVILGACKDYFADNTKGSLAHFCKDNSSTKYTQIYTGDKVTNADGTVRDRYVSCERWGMWDGTSINRIKIYGKIEKGEVPTFDGTHSGFTFSYQAKASGTVDVEKPLKKENGWSSTAFTRYASDLGVVRSVLSASAYIYLGYDDEFNTFATKLNLLKATDDTTDYKVPAQHANYFNVTVPTTGFQDMSVEFDYALRGSSAPIIVAAYLNGDKECQVLDTLDASGNGLKHASVAIPNDFANQKNLIVRLMVGKGTIATGAEFDLANLTFKGYKDFNAANDGAPKVAYLTPATDRVHVMGLSQGEDAKDVILPFMLNDKNFKVSIIAKDMWSTLATPEAVVAAFEDYDVVVASPYMTAEDLTFAQALVGKKAFLNFNAEAFLKWNANAAASADALDSVMVYSDEFYYHPVFANIDLDEAKKVVPNFYDTIVAGVKIAATETSYILAAGANSGAAALYEDFSNNKAKYIFMDMSAENSNSINSKGKQALINIVSYLKKGGNFAKPTFELLSSGAVVENTAQLLDAANYDYGVLNLSTPVIKMKTSTDENAVYNISAGISYGGNNITFQPASSSDDVVIVGALSDTTKLNATSLTFKNITFVQAADQASVITLKAKDRVRDELKFESCTFNGVNNAFIVLEGNNIGAKTITVNNNLFNAVNVPVFVQVAGDTITTHKVNITENRFNDFNINTLVNWGTVAAKEIDTDDEDGDEVMVMNISNNTFRNQNRGEAIELLSMTQAQQFDSAAVLVNNNLFYNAGSVMMHLYEAPDSVYYTSIVDAVDGSDSTVVTTVAFGTNLNTSKNFIENGEFVPGEYNWNTAECEVVTKESLAIDKVFEDAELTQISKLSPLFTAGVESGLNRAYIGAAASYVSRKAGDQTVFTVKNAQELKTALELAIGGDVIELENNVEDTLGVYQMGNTGFSYPTDGGTLTIRAAEGHQPELFGNIAPSNNNFNLSELHIENLTWNDPTVADSVRIDGYNSDMYSPFYFRAAGGYIGHFHITNSTFKNLQMQAVIRTNKCYDEGAKTGLTIGKILMDYNEFDNFGGATEDGKVAYHFIQFDVKGAYTINNFSFIENVVKNFHGSQFFNINREGALNPVDSTINVVISNNVFYKMGGNASDKYRNFIEFNKTPVGFNVNIDVTNNIFYKRWSETLVGQYPLGQLDLFDGTQVKSYSINILKNYFEGEYYTTEDTYGPNPMALTDAESAANLSLSATSAVEVNRDKPITWEDVNDWIEFDEDTEDFTESISKEYEVFTLGLAHPYNAEYSYIGAGICYGMEQLKAPVAVEDVQEAKMAIFAKNGKLFINLAEAAQVDIYHVSGKKVASQVLNAGLNEVNALNNGMYILNINGQMAKVLVK